MAAILTIFFLRKIVNPASRGRGLCAGAEGYKERQLLSRKLVEVSMRKTGYFVKTTTETALV